MFDLFRVELPVYIWIFYLHHNCIRMFLPFWFAIEFDIIFPDVATKYKKMEDQKDKSFTDRVVPLRKSRRHSKRIPQVGSPTDFKHLLHIGTDSHHVDITNVPPQVYN